MWHLGCPDLHPFLLLVPPTRVMPFSSGMYHSMPCTPHSARLGVDTRFPSRTPATLWPSSWRRPSLPPHTSCSTTTSSTRIEKRTQRHHMRTSVPLLIHLESPLSMSSSSLTYTSSLSFPSALRGTKLRQWMPHTMIRSWTRPTSAALSITTRTFFYTHPTDLADALEGELHQTVGQACMRETPLMPSETVSKKCSAIPPPQPDAKEEKMEEAAETARTEPHHSVEDALHLSSRVRDFTSLPPSSEASLGVPVAPSGMPSVEMEEADLLAMGVFFNPPAPATSGEVGREKSAAHQRIPSTALREGVYGRMMQEKKTRKAKDDGEKRNEQETIPSPQHPHGRILSGTTKRESLEMVKVHHHYTTPSGSSFSSFTTLSPSSSSVPPSFAPGVPPTKGMKKGEVNEKKKKRRVVAKWTPQQSCYRHLMKALRAAYYNDRSKLFWARHRVLVEMYKYARLPAYPSTPLDAVSLEEMTSPAVDAEENDDEGKRTSMGAEKDAKSCICNGKEKATGRTNEEEHGRGDGDRKDKTATSSSAPTLTLKVQHLVDIGHEIADFIEMYMKLDIARIVRHNEKMLSLPVREAKQFREAYFLSEKQHDSWCKQHIKKMLQRRPPPPYPFTKSIDSVE